MATVTKGRTFVSGEVVTPTKLNTLVDSATVTAIVNADIEAAAAIADTKLATIATAGKVSNSATTATSANTASAIVARDASGNFSAGTITANLTGNVTGSGNSSFGGNVGIGTSTPTARLDVTAASSKLQIDPNFSASGASYIQSSGTTSGLLVGTFDAKPVSIITSNTLRLTVDAGGSISTQGNPITNCKTTAKAWVIFDGNTSPYAIIASYNVSSVTRVASTNFYVNFTTAFANTNYAVLVSMSGSVTSGVSNAIPYTGAKGTTQAQVYAAVATTGAAPASAADQIAVAVFA